MNEAALRTLAAINLRFYAEHARAFSETRRAPWPGWERLRPRLAALAAGRSGLRLLDVGCGNGRFARFIAESLPPSLLRVEGVDASLPLLDEARRFVPHGARRFRALDFVADPEALPAGPFDAVALFGVLHGVPSRARRRALLEACARRLAPAGLLLLTLWRFAEDPRLARRRLDWEAYNARATRPVDPCELEAGDALLPWGEDGAALRYVHAFGEPELGAWIRELPLQLEARYRADGRSGALNDYLVWRAP